MFDPYYKWLGIPPKEQPPNHYRLLSINLFEADPDVIDAAANRQMAYIQQRATGEYAEISQKLLNQISAARLCLLNEEKKAEYDRTLRKSVERENTPSSVQQLAEPKKAPPMPSTDSFKGTRNRSSHQQTPGVQPWQFAVVLGVVILFALGGLAIWSLTRSPTEISERSPEGAEETTSPRRTTDSSDSGGLNELMDEVRSSLSSDGETESNPLGEEQPNPDHEENELPNDNSSDANVVTEQDDLSEPANATTEQNENPEPANGAIFKVTVEPSWASLHVKYSKGFVTGSGQERTIKIHNPDPYDSVYVIASCDGYETTEKQIWPSSRQESPVMISLVKKRSDAAKGVIEKGNIALARRGATVAGPYKGNPRNLLNGRIDDQPAKVHLNEACVVTLPKLYNLRHIRIKLSDSYLEGKKVDHAYYRYKVEVSKDGKSYETVADRTDGEWRGWQTIPFTPRPVKTIRLTGTSDYPNQTGIRYNEIEAYCARP